MAEVMVTAKRAAPVTVAEYALVAGLPAGALVQ
jgi:hypothetical protein